LSFFFYIELHRPALHFATQYANPSLFFGVSEAIIGEKQAGMYFAQSDLQIGILLLCCNVHCSLFTGKVWSFQVFRSYGTQIVVETILYI